MCQNLYLRNGYPELKTDYTSGRSTEKALLYCVSTSISATVIQSCRLHIWWKVNGNNFTLLCQYLYLRNAYPQLQTRYTSGRSTEAALLYCVSTSISGTLLPSGRLHILVEGHRKQLYSTVSVPLSRERLSTAADWIWQWKVKRKQIYSTVSGPPP